MIYCSFYEQHTVILSIFQSGVQQLPVSDLLAGILKWLARCYRTVKQSCACCNRSDLLKCHIVAAVVREIIFALQTTNWKSCQFRINGEKRYCASEMLSFHPLFCLAGLMFCLKHGKSFKSRLLYIYGNL